MTRPTTTGSTPDLKSASQVAAPNTAYNCMRCGSLNARIASVQANNAKAIRRGVQRKCFVYTVAMTSSATMSSTTTTVSMNALSLSGKRGPTSASMPSANAVSVDITVPQPCALSRAPLKAR